jgi:DNA-binding IclR family transcriptional regulator
MPRKDGAAIRKERIQEIAVSILKALSRENPLSLSKTLAALQYSTGLTKSKLSEYLDIMVQNGQFSIDVEKDQIKKVVE